MSEFQKTMVGRSLNSIRISPRFPPISKVTVIVSDDLQFSAGDNSGRNLEVRTPWGSQRIANNLLSQYKGWEYQPFEAEGASLDPAVEIGDGVSAGRIYGGIYRESLKFGPIPKSNFSAPQDEQINHEYPHIPKRDRVVNRRIGGLKSELKVQAGLISAEVTERENAVSTLQSKLKVQAGLISAKVSQTGGAEDGSFEYAIKPTYALWKANGAELLRLQAGKAELHADIYAENGYFHGNVYAGNIQHGGDAGTFSGVGLTAGTVSGGAWGAIGGGTITTANTNGGINTSLGYANAANDILTGVTEAVILKASSLTGNSVTANSLFNFKNHSCKWVQINGQWVIGR